MSNGVCVFMMLKLTDYGVFCMEKFMQRKGGVTIIFVVKTNISWKNGLVNIPMINVI